MTIRLHAIVLLAVLSLSRVVAEEAKKEEEDLSFFLPHAAEYKQEQLAIVLLKAKALQAEALKSREASRAVAAAVGAAVSTLPPISLNRALRGLKDVPVDVRNYLPAAVELLALIREMGVATTCLERPGAPHGPAGDFRYLIAANLFNCEAIMPYWVLEVLRLGLMLQGNPLVLNSYHHNSTYTVDPGWDPTLSPKVAVSIYESGSDDDTPTWLQAAEALWSAAGMRTYIVINGSLTRQMLMDPFSGKFYKQHRIQFLATLRNAALEPLYSANRGAYDFVYFINDVFFCAPDLFRLSHFKADIACGLDFEIWIGDKKGRAAGVTQRFLRRQLLSNRAAGGRTLMQFGSPLSSTTVNSSVVVGSFGLTGTAPNPTTTTDWHQAMAKMSRVHIEEAARQAAADARIQAAKIKPRYEFYDTWVSRDVGGNPFVKTDPIARDTRTIDMLHQGMPIPAKCCWNGAAVINASHLAAGLRFRASLVEDGECDISECSLFCEDYRRLGAKQVVVDPSVRVAYLAWTREVHGQLPGGVGPKVPWQHVARSGALEQLQQLWSDTQGCMSIQCVPLRKGTEEADIHAFKVIDLNRVNYTHTFLERLRLPAQPPPPPETCNLIMGPYGPTGDGRAFDDLPYADWGRRPITRIVYRVAANASGEHSGISGLQVTYDTTLGRDHGAAGVGEQGIHVLAAGEYVNGASVYHDDTMVLGIQMTTSAGRTLDVGAFPPKVGRARATPCPAAPEFAGRYRLLSFAGTSDKYLRSIILVWGTG